MINRLIPWQIHEIMSLLRNGERWQVGPSWRNWVSGQQEPWLWDSYLFLAKYSAQKCKTGFTDILISLLPGHAQGAKQLSTLWNFQLNKQFLLCLCQVFGDSWTKLLIRIPDANHLSGPMIIFSFPELRGIQGLSCDLGHTFQVILASCVSITFVIWSFL